MDKKKIKIAAGLTAVFFLGIMTGSLGTGIYVKHRIGRFVKGDLTERHAAIMKKLKNYRQCAERTVVFQAETPCRSRDGY